MSAISQELSSIWKVLDTEGLNADNLSSIEARMERLTGAIGDSTPSPDISKFVALQERIELIKPTLLNLEKTETKAQKTPPFASEAKVLMMRGREASSASRVSSRDIKKLENQGTQFLREHQKGKLPREEGETYVAAIYAHLSRPCSSENRAKLEDLRVFAETICPGFKPSVLNSPQPVPYGFHGELVEATGGINQFSFQEGSQASCASNALNFIAESLDEDPEQLTEEDVRGIIVNGKTLFDTHLLPHREVELQSLAESIGASSGEEAQEAFLRSQMGHAMSPIEVLPLYAERLGERPPSPPAETLPHNRPQGVKDHFRHIIDDKLKPHIPLGGKVATTINCNGATHALTIVRTPEDTYKFYIFDSHGKKTLNGTPAGFLYKTASEEDAIEYLSQMISLGVPYKKESLNPESLNEISYSIIKPPEEREGVVRAPTAPNEAKQQSSSTSVKMLAVATVILGLVGIYVLPKFGYFSG